MKVFRICLLLFTLSLIAAASYSQEDKRIQDLLTKVEKECSRIDSSARVTFFRKSVTGRKVVIMGDMNSFRNSFKQTVTYYKGGFKKEAIIIYKYNSLGHKVVICELVKLNDKIFSATYFETKEDNNRRLVITSKELFVSDKFYQRTYYADKKKVIRTENIFFTNSTK